MLVRKNSAKLSLAVLLSISVISESVAVSNKHQLILAQVPIIWDIPDKLPNGSLVRIASSESVDKLTENLKSKFENKYPGSKVNLKTEDSYSALKQLSNGEIDIAAIGRRLSDREKSEGYAILISSST